MPKRKHRDDDEYNTIAKKIKQLTKELRQVRPKRRRRVISSRSSSSSRSPSPSRNSIASLIAQEDSQLAESQTERDDIILEIEPEVVPSASAAEPSINTAQPSTSTAQLSISTAQPEATIIDTAVTETPDTPELDEETLLILGDDPSEQQKFGKNIQAALAVRLQHTATTGLTKEHRKEVQEKHLLPANCTLIDAPLLNPEIKAAVSEIVLRRDKGIENKQKQMANAISCVGEAVTMLISSEDKNPPLLKVLMEASRLLCDCQYTDTAVRRNFILNNVKKDLKDQLQLTKVDKYLFGQDLADTLKSAKAICKSGAELKTNLVKPLVKKPPAKPTASRNFAPTNLNWKAPPLGRRQPGYWSQRSKEPAYPKGMHANSSRTSYSAPNRGRR